MENNSRCKYLTCLFLLFLISINLNSVFPSQYEIKKFQDDPAVNSTFIYSLSKDCFGYIWIGTAEGLIRFNGKSFNTYSTADSLADNFVSCIYSDGGNVWLGHMNGSLSLFNRKNYRKIYASKNESGAITCINKDPGGNIWMSTYFGELIKLDLNKGASTVKKFKPGESLHNFLFINNRELLIATSSGLYLCNISDSEEISVNKTIIENKHIVKVLKTKAEGAYFAASLNEGIFRLSAELDINDTICGVTNIQDLSEDCFNTFWIATLTTGLYNYNITAKKLTPIKEFEGDNIKSVYADNEGNIWVGGYGTGLSQIRNKIFGMFPLDYDTYGRNVSAICHAGENVWFSTDKGLLQIDQTYRVKYFNPKFGNKITALCIDHKDNIWIGTQTDGIYKLNRENDLSKINIHSGSLEQSVTSLAVSDRFIWVGTKKGLCRISLEDREIKWFTITDGIPHNSINGLYKDKSGIIWISSRGNTIAYIKNNKIEKYSLPATNSSISFSEFAEEDSANLWVGSMGNGVFGISKDSVIQLTSEDGLYSEFCDKLIHDKHNHIWVIHKDGLSRIDTRNYFIRTYDDFGTNLKISFNPRSASMDVDGKIWLGTDSGVLVIDQSSDVKADPSIPEIISVRANNEVINPVHGFITLKPGKYTIEIEYSAVSQKDPDMVFYRVFLGGYDQQPETTNQTTVVYRNLSRGTFNFRLSAVNGDGLWSETPLSLEIHIRTPLLQQWWFYLILLAFAGILITLHLKRREYMHQEERKKLEEKVLERTREIQAQKDEIEQQHDLIHLKNAEITSSIRYALEIQNAMLPSLSKFERYFPESFIFMKPKDIVSGDFYWLAKKNERLVFTVADCTGHGVPGAFMSLLSIATLNEIVNIEGITDSDKIISRLHVLIRKSLNRSREDGLDMALCVYDWTNRTIQFTGAMNDLAYFHNGELNLIKGDPFSVNMISRENITFSMHELIVNKGDIIYLYSDGYMDQFGGCRDKKFSTRRFYDMLREIHQLPMTEQKQMLEQKLQEWKCNNIQTDDITLMGIRF